MPRGAEKLMYLDVAAYIDALRKSFKKMVQELRNDVMEAAKWNARDIDDWKKNPVQMVGYMTSDYQRKSAVWNSFVTTRAQEVDKTLVRATVHALARNFKESHIGLYYEYGTGREQKEGYYDDLGDLNPFRVHSVGAAIVTRSRYIGLKSGMYPGKSIWKDAGGNYRVTGSRRGGDGDHNDAVRTMRTKKGYRQQNVGFRNYIGPDVKPHYWFRDSLTDQQVIRRIESLKNEAIKRVPIQNYIRGVVAPGGRKTYVLGKDHRR